MISDTNESEISKGKTEEALISSLLEKTFYLKVTQTFVVSINTYKQGMIAVGNEKKKIRKYADGIIVITCLCYDCWKKIIVNPYFIRLNVLFGLTKQKKY